MSINTKEKILNSAIKIFIENGYSGARMRDIADEAGINKGLLHYYFKSKNALFIEVIKTSAQDFFPKLGRILHSDKTLFEKIELIVDEYIEMLLKNPHFPPFIVNELNHNADIFIDTLFSAVSIPDKTFVFSLIREEVSKGTIKPVNPLHLILDTLSLIIYPFLARPALKKISGMNDEQFYDLMRLRKRTIVDTLINNIKL